MSEQAVGSILLKNKYAEVADAPSLLQMLGDARCLIIWYTMRKLPMTWHLQLNLLYTIPREDPAILFKRSSVY